MKYRISILLISFLCSFMANAREVVLYPVLLSQNDQPSLQRGAKIYFNYCSGCHSLNYLRYNRLAQDLSITDSHGQLLTTLVARDLIFTGDKISDAIKIAMPSSQAQHWFKKVPPDLSVFAKAKGSDWLYTYLRSFYSDSKRLWGTNNRLVPNVAMPNVLLNLQGVQLPVYKAVKNRPITVHDISHLVLIAPGSLTPQQFNVAMADLVNFLVFVSEPNSVKREHLGFWVVLYFLLLAGALGFLYRSYWKK